MRRTVFILCMCALSLVQGCRPLMSPMPVRLEDEQQKSINESWEKTLVPVDRFDSQTLLDIFLATNAYQCGVDKLEFLSEKRYSGGTIVMEIHYDRLFPEKDRFTVKILDSQGKILRQESYDRKQIDKTDKELSVDYNYLRRKHEENRTTADEIKRLEAYEARLAVIEQIFPKFEENRKKD